MRLLTCALLAVLLALGCGRGSSSGLVPVTGTVTLDGQPLAGATVGFLPQGDLKGGGGGGGTDAAGKYQVLSSGSQKGLLPGRYKVTISRRLMPDGKPPTTDLMPGVPPGQETLPPQYSDLDKTTLSANVTAGSGPIDFALKSGR
jgi:hypothetical protein